MERTSDTSARIPDIPTPAQEGLPRETAAGAHPGAGEFTGVAGRLSAAAPYVPAALTLALVIALAFRGGGYIVGSATVPVVAYGLAAAVWAVAWRPRPQLSRPLMFGLAGLAGYALWAGLSVIWSVGPDLTWEAFDYAALYLLAAAALTAVPASRGRLRLACYGYLAGAVAIAVYAFLGKVVPEHVTHAHQYARLSQPIGYWNVLAIMLVMAVPAALAVTARRQLPALVRAAVAGALALLLLTLFFTFSRGGFLAFGLVLIVYFAATRPRLMNLVSLLAAAVPVGLVLYHLRGLDTLFAPTQDAALRSAQGHTLGWWSLLAIGVAFAAQLGVALLQRRVTLPVKAVRGVGIVVLSLVVLVFVGGPLVYMQAHGGVADWLHARYDAFVHGSQTETGGDTAGRLLVVSSNGRIELYRVSLKQSRYHRLTGTGAGTFTFSNYRFRTSGTVVKHAHSQWFNALSELGIVGVLAYAAAVVGLLAASLVAVVRRRRDTERALLAACLAAAVGFMAHASIDWDWDMAAGTLAFLLLVTAAATYRGAQPEAGLSGEAVPANGEATPASGEASPAAAAAAPARRRLPWPAAAVVCVAVAFGAAAWLLPFFSVRAYNLALAEVAQGKPDAAAVDARRAQRLDPLAVDPLVVLSLVEQQRGEPQLALDALNKAVKLQPDNWQVRYQLGLLLVNVLGRERAGVDELRRALSLNPRDALIAYQLRLHGGP